MKYDNGDGIAKDVGAAVKWYRKAAEQNFALAQCNLGDCYSKGEGVVKNKTEAVKWFRKAAEQNLPDAEYGLGECYYKGEGVTNDYVEAAKWFHKAADQNFPDAEFNLGECYHFGKGVTIDYSEAVKWYRKAAEQNLPEAQVSLGHCYQFGWGVIEDRAESEKWCRKAAEQNNPEAELFCFANGFGNKVERVEWLRKAAKQNNSSAQEILGEKYEVGDEDLEIWKDSAESLTWYHKAAEQNDIDAEYNLGKCYYNGIGVPKDYSKAVKWYRKAAENDSDWFINPTQTQAQYDLGLCYAKGNGVAKDYVQAYKWMNLASARNNQPAKEFISIIEPEMTADQIAEAQRLTREFKPGQTNDSESLTVARHDPMDSNPKTGGTGFFISDDGYLISNYHVIKDATLVRLLTSSGFISAKIVKVDVADDLALLKVRGIPQGATSLPIAPSRGVKLGGTVATVGFPNIVLQGFAPKLAKGEIASLSGAGDDARYFQISVPVQHGNSGGALVNERGNVIGVVSARLGVAIGKALTSDELPENVNYAVKSSFLLSFLESVPEVSAKLKEPNTKEEKFEDVVKSAQDAAVLVLVY